ncbi:hypothetical protein C499_15825 [Halogeometricum borinquense DSM 11551]|uniref:DUF7344 domain-containing protein n=2 Tax=Halogeometricum borinquense TaxID=60847 RepID=E4NS29_HALBP|nr:hypothetical protein [Halogeometricum borinquense]ADQ68075.1 hypothetical protein Hbor_25210 [Halogeometricum borinquense DSM 11551]ELY24881.1 hypothetical protein C499_15825 [Halogeometricum borinquense DSM 11551]RYJ13012.1 hypothetical protein ELS19_02865 [Halogeometricum borinquense]
MTRDSDVDGRFVAFADVVRRRLLYYLCSSSSDANEIAFETLVSRLADDDTFGSHTRAQMRLNLVHVHLPKLEQANLIEHDDGTVRLVVAPDVVTRSLELAHRFDSI